MLYKFLGKNSGRETLDLLQKICNQRTLLASDPTTFNDPFEFKFNLDLDADQDTIRNRYFSDNPSANMADFENWRGGMAQSKWYVTQQTRAHLLGSCGVICFTTGFKNHLLWSHYTNNHQGVCLGFDDSIISTLPGVQWHGHVVYHHEVPTFRFFYDNPADFRKKVVAYKSNCWSYEEEYRLTFGEAGVINFPMEGLREIILGCRAYPELRDFAYSNLNSTEYGFSIMHENFGSYSLEKKPIEEKLFSMTSFF